MNLGGFYLWSRAFLFSSFLGIGRGGGFVRREELGGMGNEDFRNGLVEVRE